MTHDDYLKALQADKKFAMARCDEWQSKLNEAEEQLENWRRQRDALLVVSIRVEVTKTSAFNSK